MNEIYTIYISPGDMYFKNPFPNIVYSSSPYMMKSINSLDDIFFVQLRNGMSDKHLNYIYRVCFHHK